MYSVPDDDLELLESYLDDALSDEETEALRRRLAHEPNLVAAMRQLREERSQRQAYFQSIDPSPKEVEELLSSIRTAANRKPWYRDQGRLTRWGSAVAACLAIAVTGGFVYHSWDKSPLRQGGGEVAVTKSDAPGVATQVGQYTVEVTDENGRVQAVQHFDDKNLADDFRRDLRQMQTRHRQSQGGVMLIENNNDF